MAHKKGVGSTDNGRDSNSKRLGVKLFGGQAAKAGNVIVRQRGTKFHPGENVYMGKDFTLHARLDGVVTFKRKKNNRTYVNILPDVDPHAAPAAAASPKAETVVADAPVEEATPQVVETPVASAPPVEEEPKAEEKAEAPVAEKKAPAKKKEKIVLPSGKKINQDDLKIVEGIGPKIEGLLNEGGIHTWKDLAEADVEKVQAILDEAGPRYRMHDPATWAKQAKMAFEANWEELEAYQDRLQGGREVDGEEK